MIIVDNALKARAATGNPIQVGLIGAGFMGRGIASQIVNSVPGMRLAAIANRTLAQASRAYAEAGAPAPTSVNTASQLDDAIRRGDYAVTEDPDVVIPGGRLADRLRAEQDALFAPRKAAAAASAAKSVALVH